MTGTVFPLKMLAITAAAVTILFVGGFLISGNQPVQSQQPVPAPVKDAVTATPVVNNPVTSQKPSPQKKQLMAIAKKPNSTRHTVTAPNHIVTNTADSSTTVKPAEDKGAPQTDAVVHDNGPTPLNEMLVMGLTSTEKAAHHTTGVEEAHPKTGWVNFERYLNDEAVSSDEKSGEVKLTFTVTGEGTLGDFKIKKGLSDIADQKAIELVKGGPGWVGNADKTVKEITVILEFHH